MVKVVVVVAVIVLGVARVGVIVAVVKVVKVVAVVKVVKVVMVVVVVVDTHANTRKHTHTHTHRGWRDNRERPGARGRPGGGDAHLPAGDPGRTGAGAASSVATGSPVEPGSRMTSSVMSRS